MKYAGIDIGSRTIKLAIVEDDVLLTAKKAYTTYNPLQVCNEMLEGAEFDVITATGYGRHLFQNYRNCGVITEIKAFAVGAWFINPNCRTVLDIGGQDTKAISIDGNGGIVKFEMNDKCAAGTGRFLEIMAAALGYDYHEFASFAASAERAEPVNNMCTVFAESEVISLVTCGIPRNEIALGIHKSITARAVNLLKRVSIKGDFLFAGGVALNSCVVDCVERETGHKVYIPEDPQIVGAIGCAVSASRDNAAG